MLGLITVSNTLFPKTDQIACLAYCHRLILSWLVQGLLTSFLRRIRFRAWPTASNTSFLKRTEQIACLAYSFQQPPTDGSDCMLGLLSSTTSVLVSFTDLYHAILTSP